MNRILIKAGVAVISLGFASPAFADDHNGEELRGQTVDIQFADGSRNAVFFGSTGTATIANTTGQRENATWFVEGERLCLSGSAATECFAYTNRFEAGRAVSMASDCNPGTTWTARGVNPPRQEVAATSVGEKG